MLTEDEWREVKARWIAEGKMTDDEGYWHYTKEKENGRLDK